MAKKPEKTGAAEASEAAEKSLLGEHLDQEKDIYALPSKDQTEVYFLALVDILTTYGVKKQAAKYAKTVTYGANKVEGISTIEPDQYAARFLEFIANAME